MVFEKAAILLAIAAVAFGGSLRDFQSAIAFDVECTPDCPTDDAVFPDPRDCTQFYQCVDGVVHLRTCSFGYEYSESIGACVPPEQSGCVADPDAPCGDGTTAAPEPDTTTTTAAPTTTTTTEAPTTTEEVTTAAPADCIPSCPSPDAVFADPRDCTKFYQCVNDVVHERTCSFGYEYDAAIGACVPPDQSGCVADPSAPCDGDATTVAAETTTTTEEPTTTAEPTTTTTTAEPTTTSTTEAAATTAGPDCIPPCPSADAVYPDPQDCTKFFQCVDGVVHERTCSFGYEFSPSIGACVPPSQSDCTASPDAPCEAVPINPAFLFLGKFH